MGFVQVVNKWVVCWFHTLLQKIFLRARKPHTQFASCSRQLMMIQMGHQK